MLVVMMHRGCSMMQKVTHNLTFPTNGFSHVLPESIVPHKWSNIAEFPSFCCHVRSTKKVSLQTEFSAAFTHESRDHIPPGKYRACTSIGYRASAHCTMLSKLDLDPHAKVTILQKKML